MNGPNMPDSPKPTGTRSGSYPQCRTAPIRIPSLSPRLYAETRDDGARLDTYEARRRRTVDEITEDLDRAIGAARRAATGLATIGYHVEVVAKVEDMIGAGNDARELLNMFEGRVT